MASGKGIHVVMAPDLVRALDEANLRARRDGGDFVGRSRLIEECVRAANLTKIAERLAKEGAGN